MGFNDDAASPRTGSQASVRGVEGERRPAGGASGGWRRTGSGRGVRRLASSVTAGRCERWERQHGEDVVRTCSVSYGAIHGTHPAHRSLRTYLIVLARRRPSTVSPSSAGWPGRSGTTRSPAGTAGRPATRSWRRRPASVVAVTVQLPPDGIGGSSSSPVEATPARWRGRSASPEHPNSPLRLAMAKPAVLDRRLLEVDLARGAGTGASARLRKRFMVVSLLAGEAGRPVPAVRPSPRGGVRRAANGFYAAHRAEEQDWATAVLRDLDVRATGHLIGVQEDIHRAMTGAGMASRPRRQPRLAGQAAGRSTLT